MSKAQTYPFVFPAGRLLGACSHVEWWKELRLLIGVRIRSKFSSARVGSRTKNLFFVEQRLELWSLGKG